MVDFSDCGSSDLYSFGCVFETGNKKQNRKDINDEPAERLNLSAGYEF